MHCIGLKIFLLNMSPFYPETYKSVKKMGKMLKRTYVWLLFRNGSKEGTLCSCIHLVTNIYKHNTDRVKSVLSFIQEKCNTIKVRFPLTKKVFEGSPRKKLLMKRDTFHVHPCETQASIQGNSTPQSRIPFRARIQLSVMCAIIT